MSHHGRHPGNRHNTLPALHKPHFPPAAMPGGDMFLGRKLDHAGESDAWHGLTDAAWDQMSVAELFDALEKKIPMV